jgi:hypothetical protein
MHFVRFLDLFIKIKLLFCVCVWGLFKTKVYQRDLGIKRGSFSTLLLFAPHVLCGELMRFSKQDVCFA